MSQQLPSEFIRNTLIKRIGNINQCHPYLSFGLIGAGIEFLGKCLDEQCSWHQPHQSSRHIEIAIKKLFPTTYHPHIKMLISDLRAGMLHALLPGVSIALTELANIQNSETAKNYHLKIEGGRLIIVAENFYDDFQNACQAVLQMQFPKNNKMSRPLLEVI